MSEGPVLNRPGHDIYTVLVIFATIVAASATVYLAVRGHALFGSWNPFSPTAA